MKFLLSVLVCGGVCLGAAAATFTVINTNNADAGSLRQAILDANASLGADTIQFQITNAVRAVLVSSNLPVISDPVMINGATQAGYSNAPIVELSGGGIAGGLDGLRIATSNTTIRALVIRNFTGDGIEISGGGSNVVEGCYIGLNLAGATDQGNSLNGILITNSANNRIGGTSLAARNVISGNDDHGIRIAGANATNNQVFGNIIGLNAAGDTRRGNTDQGVFIDNAPGNLVGGSIAGARNVIAANFGAGVRLLGLTASNNVVQGNFIGTDLGGAAGLANATAGVQLDNAPNNLVGGNTTAARNTISGNNGVGVALIGVNATNNAVRGNFIGTDFGGTLPLANGSYGVHFDTSARFNTVGGTGAGEANLIAFNGSDGVFVASGTNNTVRANRLFANVGLGIDIGANGVTANDATDTDTGANQLQNFPVLTNATGSAASVTIQGSLTSRPSTTYQIDFFANQLCDPTGNGEGQFYLGSTNVTTDAGGSAALNVTLAVPLSGRFIAASATDPLGNTSELSPCVRASSSITPATFTVVNTNNSGAGSLRQAMLDSNDRVSSGTNRIQFSIPAGGVQTIAPVPALPVISEAVVMDGYSQPGATSNTLADAFNGNLLIRLDGVSAGTGADGLALAASSSTVRGFVVVRFNGDGIHISSAGNTVSGNVIGLDVNGADLGNSDNGVFIESSGANMIGGTTPASRNVISGNRLQGVLIANLTASGNVVQGNLIGTDPGGTLPRDNGDGVQIDNAPNNVIGGTTAGARNVLSGNSDGIQIFTAGATNNLVQGNFIGTDVTGTLPLPNTGHGINFVTNPRWNVIGGTTAGAGNLIAFNGADGVFVSAGTNNAVRANRIHSNTGLGIDVGANNVTTNDVGDADGGANQLQNFPTLTNAFGGASSVTIQGFLTSRSNTIYQIDFFANQLGDPTGNGEGQFYLGSTNVTTDAGGIAALNVAFAVPLSGRYMAATATDPLGNTSEFSPCVRASSSIAPATFTVINTNDSGIGSLRKAILDSNARISSGTNRIQFNIPAAGVQMIAPTSALPVISETAAIDGYSQPGATSNTLANAFNANLLIRLDGAGAGTGADGLALAATNGTVRGFMITRFKGDGIHVSAGGNTVVGNVIGLDAGGTDLGNVGNGVFIESSGANIIGGTTPASRNVISGNTLQGVLIANLTASGNVVQGNLIGPDPGGTLPRGNSGGVQINDAPNNVIGGTTAGARNVISGNSDGIQISTAGATNNLVLGNFIGTDATGTQPLPNTGHGINFVTNPRWNVIGGTNAGAGNLIAFNGADGVFVSAGTNNAVRANQIHSNTGLGIDIGANNVTTNDVGDADSGANLLQNFPLLTNAVGSAGSTLIQGTLNSRASTVYSLDFFGNTVRDPSANGEGQFYLGSASVTTDGGGNANINVTLPVTLSGGFVSATATDPFGNTSEFSPCASASSTIPPATFTVVNTNNTGVGSLRQAILDSNARVSSTNNTIVFNIPGGGVQTIAPATELPVIVTPVTIDGFTQPGASANTLSNGYNSVLRIRLNGAATGVNNSGLVIAGNDSIVRGLIIVRFDDYGIELSGARRTRIEGNIIGLEVNSTNAGNKLHGVYANNSAETVIGGLSPAARNIISWNGNEGIHIANPPASNNVVQGNFIGTDLTGTLDCGNSRDGVQIDNAPGNFIGGTVAGARNVISGNHSVGVEIFNAGATNNRVQGNLIGTDITGVLPVPNSSHGVWIRTSARMNLIGGTNAGAGNLIWFNGDDGVYFQSGTNNAIRGNSIARNGTFTELGIDLGGSGVTANDLGDGDTGVNLQQNFPLITNAVLNAASTIVQGTLNSAASQTYELDFYANLECDYAGYGEGQQWLGSRAVTTDGSGNAAFDFTLPGFAVGRFITATATDAGGNSSEFSACARASSTRPPQLFTVVNTNDSGAGSLRQAILDNNAAFSAGPNTIRFNIPGSGVRTILPQTSLSEIFESVLIDGFSQPGASANSSTGADNAVRLIRIDSSGGGILSIEADGSTVRGLVIVNSASSGVAVSGSSNIISGNALGLDTDGTVRANQRGVVVFGTGTGNRVGGTLPAERNLIVGLHARIDLSGRTNYVQGNFLGTDATGTTGLDSSIAGIAVGGVGNVIGGPESGARNLIARGTEAAILHQSSGTIIQGNYIGVDITGTAALNPGAIGHGIFTRASAGLTIGGAAPGAGNLISGLDGVGIWFQDGANNGNVIQGNRIGTDASGTLPLGNDLGIQVSSGTSNVISGNIIAFNRGTGVRISAGTNNSILGNSIFASGYASEFGDIYRGISLGATLNDPGDADTGPNQLQNYPEISYAVVSGGQTTVRARLNSRPSRIYRLEFFRNPSCDATGFGEGKTFLGATNVTTDASGNAVGNITFAVALVAGEVITATATDPEGNTSEFSTCVPGVPAGSVDLRLVGSNGPDPVRLGGTVTYVFGVTNIGPATATAVTLTNRLPAGATFVSAVLSQGSFSQAGGVVTCNLGSLALEASATVTVMAHLNTPGPNRSTNNVTAAQFENVPANNSVNLFTTVGFSDLAVGVSASPNPVTAGQPLTLNVTLTNNGPDPASGVTIQIHPGHLLVGSSLLPYRGLSVSVSSGSFYLQTISGRQAIGWLPATLAVGASTTAQVVIIPTQAGSHTNEVRFVTVSGIDTNFANNVATAGGTVNTGPGILDLDPTYTVREDGGSATITVRRTGGANGTVTVNYSTLTGTATAGSDYTTTSGTLTFTPGVLTNTFSVPIANDGVAECNETVQLRLTNPSGGAVLVERTNALLHIYDNDYPAPPLPELVSAAQTPGVITPDFSLLNNPVLGALYQGMTPDGRYVAYASDAPYLAATDRNESYDVFVFDRVTQTTTLASVNGTGTDTGGSSGVFEPDSDLPSLSDDGRYVAFRSHAEDLVALSDSNDGQDVFVRDMATATTTLVSVKAAGTGTGNFGSDGAEINATGQKVVFQSYANNLVNLPFPGLAANVFVRTLASNTTALVSVNQFGTAAGNGDSLFPQISSNGLFVAFKSDASDLVANDTNGVYDVFVRNLTNGTTALVSVNRFGTGSGNGDSELMAISQDGRYVAFESAASNLVTNDNNAYQDIFVRDLVAGVTLLVSANTNGTGSGNHHSYFTSMTRNGRYIAFHSLANNFTTNSANGGGNDVFVRDIVAGTTRLVSSRFDGLAAANGDSQHAYVSEDGRYVAFESDATDLLVQPLAISEQAIFLRDLVTGSISVLTNEYTGAVLTPGILSGISANGRIVLLKTRSPLVPADGNWNIADLFVRDWTLSSDELASGVLSATPSLGADAEPLPLLSADGRVVVFDSNSDDVVPGDLNNAAPPIFPNLGNDIFASDLTLDTTVAVSRNASGTGTGNDLSEAPSMTPDGRLIAFQSLASNLLVTPAAAGVYLHNRLSGVTTPVSVNTNGVPVYGELPHISANGRFVAFESSANNLAAGDFNGTTDMFVRDLALGSTVLASATPTGQSGNGESSLGVLSPSGRHVIFRSTATDLVPGDTNVIADYFIRDLIAGTTDTVAGGPPRGNSGFSAIFSQDGRFVSFGSSDPLLAANDSNFGNDIFLRDLVTGTVRLVSRNLAGTGPGNQASSSPALSANGRYVVFHSLASNLVLNDTNGVQDVFRHDLWTGTTELVSVNCAGATSGNGLSEITSSFSAGRSPTASVSADGRFVVFDSRATDLAPGDYTRSLYNVFVRDMLLGESRLLSVNQAGTAAADSFAGNPGSYSGTISADGGRVVFISDATDLIANDRNLGIDVFAVHLPTTSPSADLSLTMTGAPNPAGVSSNVTYTLGVTNHGPATATNIMLLHSLPAAGFVSANLTQGSFTRTNNTLVANIGSLATSARATLTVIVNASAPGTLLSVASVTAYQPDLNPANNYGSVATGVGSGNVVPQPTMAFSLSGNQLELSWSEASSGYSVQETPSLSPPVVWSPSTNAVLLSGGRFRIFVNTSIGRRFFRLARGSGGGVSPPSLNVSRAGNVFAVRWPSAATTFALQTTTNLAPVVQWNAISSGIVDDGTWKTYALTNSPDRSRFFRLIQQP